MKKNDYFKKYCDVLHGLLSRGDKGNPAIKDIIRYSIRQAINHATDLPGYDNKLGACKVSNKAYEQIKKGDLKDLVGEHMVPISEINKLILTMLPLTQEKLRVILKSFPNKAVITKEEDNQLKKKGLKQKMPSDWNEKDEEARYKEVGIKLVTKTYKKALDDSKHIKIQHKAIS